MRSNSFVTIIIIISSQSVTEQAAASKTTTPLPNPRHNKSQRSFANSTNTLANTTTTAKNRNPVKSMSSVPAIDINSEAVLLLNPKQTHLQQQCNLFATSNERSNEWANNNTGSRKMTISKTIMTSSFYDRSFDRRVWKQRGFSPSVSSGILLLLHSLINNPTNVTLIMAGHISSSIIEFWLRNEWTDEWKAVVRSRSSILFIFLVDETV